MFIYLLLGSQASDRLVAYSPGNSHAETRDPHADAQRQQHIFQQYEEHSFTVAYAVQQRHPVDPVVAQSAVLSVEDIERGYQELEEHVGLEHRVVVGGGPVSSVKQHETGDREEDGVEHGEPEPGPAGAFGGLHDIGGHIEEIEEEECDPSPVAPLWINAMLLAKRT